MPITTASLAAAAAAVWVAPRSGPTRSRKAARTDRARDRSTQVAPAAWLAWVKPAAGPGVAAVAIAVLLDLSAAAGIAVGLAAAAAGWLLARRRAVAAAAFSGAELQSAAGLFDLIAACLTAGIEVHQAAQQCAAAVGTGRVAATLAHAAAARAVGMSPAAAWARVADWPQLAPFAHAAARSADGGVRLAAAARETAAQLRSEYLAGQRESAARAGVAITGPLALCFLPAFICLGLAPVVIGLIQGLQLW